MRYLVSLLLSLYTIFSFAAASVQVTNPQKAIFVQPNAATITITLQSNPTTGYSWFLKGYNHFLVQPVSHSYTSPADNIPGAPGFETWNFTVTAEAFKVPQVTTVQLAYMRPWEPNNQQIQ